MTWSSDHTGAHMGEAELVEAARRGDDDAFAQIVARYRPDLRLHCYRMLGSLEEAEDMTQETLVRAWQALGRYEGRAGVRTWLHRIATNACLDLLARQQRRRRLLAESGASQVPAAAAVPWLQPYPDSLLDQVTEPATAAVTRETVELVFIAALQFLPDAQRAALILRDILGWPATECAQLLGVSVAAVTSAVQRARTKLRERLGPDRSQWTGSTTLTDREAAVLNRYMKAIETADDHAIASLLAPTVRVSHQAGAGGHYGTEPMWYTGRETILARWAPALHGPHNLRMRMVATAANRQPAAATYIHIPGDPVYRPFSLSVVAIDNGFLTELAQFGPDLFPLFHLPATLDPPTGRPAA
ncbi:RNA polymerase sigma-70 factor (ECF subfamily) [Nonomuraea polychroma]|uniref:RNA polymerase sigma-70 factor (ECF subfamily) n=1 Tax=Nonomuraea polychroma TaxID=46176 RepID=A0A438MC41_9ACTN|nr:RNA polymerase subunit sigma-70 [Nonomuraea polychroma]RVX43313.1 RNA polymerase sigma-70 factor (ECF subfamily) [Nonomuraea polychroma]